MKRTAITMTERMILVMMAVVLCATIAQADTFGTGGNEFDINFVTISGDASSANGTNIGSTHNAPGYVTFADPSRRYRIGTYEITNDQWDKFTASLGVPVTGDPSDAYDESAYHTGTDVPANKVSWLEVAQFVNWLNTSTGHHAAYNFTGTQGQSDYAFALWTTSEADGGTNLYRHKDAFYFLPTEDEWVKAAYWNGSDLQTYATPDDSLPIDDVEANYEYDYGCQPWDVGSGSEELNGTFDMMGNILEWTESPEFSGDYATDSSYALRGASYYDDLGAFFITSAERDIVYPTAENFAFGFRVASVPEPATLGMLALGGLALLRKRRCNSRY